LSANVEEGQKTEEKSLTGSQGCNVETTATEQQSDELAENRVMTSTKKLKELTS
jgi:hypothetical protein